MPHYHRAFMGAKLALFLGPDLLCLQRDDRPGLLWPGYWDLGGGGREGAETPLACALRETLEEFALRVPPAQVHWGRAYTNSVGQSVWFFVGWAPVDWADRVRLDNEGQDWSLIPVAAFLARTDVVEVFKPRLRDYLAGANSDAFQKEPPAN